MRGDEDNAAGGPDKSKDDSTPLDMEDDFGGCLEDIDRDHRDGYFYSLLVIYWSNFRIIHKFVYCRAVL